MPNAVATLIDTTYIDAADIAYADNTAASTMREAEAELRWRGCGSTAMLESRLQDVMMATNIIKAWVADNRKGATPNAVAKRAIQLADKLPRKMLRCIAGRRQPQGRVGDLSRWRRRKGEKLERRV
jgi:ESCRT-I complex subunit TSG101